MPEADSTSDRCSWCGIAVEAGGGFRAAEHPGDRGAVFCRLEHVVPWALRGARWGAGSAVADGRSQMAGNCSHCDAVLGDIRVVLTRHRGQHRVVDMFCSADHLAEWAKAGGRWR